MTDFRKVSWDLGKVKRKVRFCLCLPLMYLPSILYIIIDTEVLFLPIPSNSVTAIRQFNKILTPSTGDSNLSHKTVSPPQKHFRQGLSIQMTSMFLIDQRSLSLSSFIEVTDSSQKNHFTSGSPVYWRRSR